MTTISMLELLVAKARAMAETAGTKADSAMMTVVKELRSRGIKPQSYEASTRGTDAQITVFTNTKYEMLIQVGDDGKFEVQLWDIQTQQLTGEGFTKSFTKMMSDIKKYAMKIKSTAKPSTNPKAVIQPKADKTMYVSGGVKFTDVFCKNEGRGKARAWTTYIVIDDERHAVAYHGTDGDAAQQLVDDIKSGAVKLKNTGAGNYVALQRTDGTKPVAQNAAPIAEPAKGKKWPKFNGSAVKARNFIKKTIGGKFLQGIDGPKAKTADNVVRLEHSLTKRQAIKFVELARLTPGVATIKNKSQANSMQVTYDGVVMYISLMTGLVVLMGNKNTGR